MILNWQGEMKRFLFLTEDLEQAAANSDAILLLVDHRQFFELNPGQIAEHVKSRYIFDTRNVINKSAWMEMGFTVRVLGDGRDD